MLAKILGHMDFKYFIYSNPPILEVLDATYCTVLDKLECKQDSRLWVLTREKAMSE